MDTAWLLKNMVSALLLPPLNLVLICAAGLLVRRTRPCLGACIAFASLLLLLGLSIHAASRWLAASLESEVAALPERLPTLAPAQAIVILGGGRLKNAPEYAGREIVTSNVLARLRYGARLHRMTGLPILVTGGRPDGGSESEAALMAESLRDDFAAPVRWVEPSSIDTAENADFSAKLLKPAGVWRILLVTDALHMPRSHEIFERHGFDVVPAPTVFLSTAPWSVADIIPRASALANSQYALREWIGLAWYRLRY